MRVIKYGNKLWYAIHLFKNAYLFRTVSHARHFGKRVYKQRIYTYKPSNESVYIKHKSFGLWYWTIFW